MRKISRRQFIRVSALATAGSLLAACGTPAPEVEEVATEAPVATKPPEPTEAPEDEPADEPAAEDMPWPREDVPRERSFVWMMGYSGGQFGNVGLVSPYGGGSHQFSHAAEIEPLFYYSAFADKTYAWLAESYEYNDDATEVTVFIRKGVTWSDGEDFTGEDLVFTIEMLMEHAPALRNSAVIKSKVAEVELVDDYTVHITLAQPDWRFIYNYFSFRYDLGTYLVPEHIFKDVEDPMTFGFFDPEQGWPVVTGAYQTTVFQEQYKHLDRRYSWWAEEIGMAEMPEVERITQYPMSDLEVAAQMIINNDLDTALGMQPHMIRSVVEQAPHIITHTEREAPYGYIDWWPCSMWFNTLEAPYDNVDVRWAIAYAIDQQQVIDVGWEGAGEPLTIPYPRYAPLAPYFEVAEPLLAEKDPRAFKPDMTATLMEGAGFTKDAEGFWVDAEGNRPDAQIYADPGIFGNLAPIVAEQLRDAGFDSTHVAPPDVWAAKSDGRALLHFFGHGGSIADPFATLDMYHSRHVKPTGENCGANRARWGDPAYDAIVEEMDRTPMGDPKLVDLFESAIALWLDALPEVPITQFYHRIAMNTTYWTNWPTVNNAYVNGAPWHLTFPLILWNLKAV
jgi:peptide/nickel transport system substrate-binding protein